MKAFQGRELLLIQHRHFSNNLMVYFYLLVPNLKIFAKRRNLLPDKECIMATWLPQCYSLIIIHSCLQSASHFFWKFSCVLRTRAAKTFPFGVIHISKIVKCSCFSHLDEDISRVYILKSEVRYYNAYHIYVLVISLILWSRERKVYTGHPNKSKRMITYEKRTSRYFTFFLYLKICMFLFFFDSSTNIFFFWY